MNILLKPMYQYFQQLQKKNTVDGMSNVVAIFGIFDKNVITIIFIGDVGNSQKTQPGRTRTKYKHSKRFFERYNEIKKTIKLMCPILY